MKTPIAILLALAIALPVLADEVTDFIEEGLAAYKAEKYSEAATSLEYAATLIKQKKGEKIGDVFPDAPAGWDKEPSPSTAAGASYFGGGISATCDYRERDGSGSADIAVISDSPIIQALLMGLQNPMILTADGSKLGRVAGRKAKIKYEAEERRGEIGVIVANSILVQINGDDIDEKLLMGLAEAIDWDRLEEIAQE